jgi:hypothetical protein
MGFLKALLINVTLLNLTSYPRQPRTVTIPRDAPRPGAAHGRRYAPDWIRWDHAGACSAYSAISSLERAKQRCAHRRSPALLGVVPVVHDRTSSSASGRTAVL